MPPNDERWVDLEENIVQRQCDLNGIAVAPGRKKLRRSAAEFAKGNLNSPLRQLRQDFFQGYGNRCLTHVGLHDSALKFERERTHYGLQRDFNTISVPAIIPVGLRPGPRRAGCRSLWGGGELRSAGRGLRKLFSADMVVNRLAVENIFQEPKHSAAVR